MVARWVAATRRNSNEREGGNCKGENYEVTSGGACTSFRFRSRSTLSLLLQPPPGPSPSSALPLFSCLFSSRVWSWRLDGSLARFSGPLFHRRSLFLSFSYSPSLSLSPPRAKPPSTIFRWTPVQRNFAQWRNLAITIACPYSRSYPIAYTSPLPAEVSSAPPPPYFPFLIRARVALCMRLPLPLDKLRVRRTVRTGLVYIYNTGRRAKDGIDVS